MFKVNNRNTGTKCEICSKLTIKTPGRRHWLRSCVFISNFEHISHRDSIVNFEQVNAGWGIHPWPLFQFSPSRKTPENQRFRRVRFEIGTMARIG